AAQLLEEAIDDHAGTRNVRRLIAAIDARLDHAIERRVADAAGLALNAQVDYRLLRRLCPRLRRLQQREVVLHAIVCRQTSRDELRQQQPALPDLLDDGYFSRHRRLLPVLLRAGLSVQSICRTPVSNARDAVTTGSDRV